MKTARRTSQESGFTLVELLAAVAIFSIVMASAYTIIGTGLKARDKHNVELQQNARAAIGAVSSALASSVPPGSQGGYEFTGGTSEISFHAYPEDATAPVRMEFHAGHGESCSGLCERITPVPAPPDIQSAVVPVAGGIKSVTFDYLGKAGWSQTWDTASGLPEAVRITVTAESGGSTATFEETVVMQKLQTPEESAEDARVARQQ